MLLRSFLDSTRSQLSIAGLFELSSTLGTGSLVALFRASHLSVLLRGPEGGPALFTLVTDAAFTHEPRVVWESLADLDGSSADFYDAELRPSRLTDNFVSRSAPRPRSHMDPPPEQLPVLDMAAINAQGDAECANVTLSRADQAASP